MTAYFQAKKSTLSPSTEGKKQAEIELSEQGFFTAFCMEITNRNHSSNFSFAKFQQKSIRQTSDSPSRDSSYLFRLDDWRNSCVIIFRKLYWRIAGFIRFGLFWTSNTLVSIGLMFLQTDLRFHRTGLPFFGVRFEFYGTYTERKVFILE